MSSMPEQGTCPAEVFAPGYLRGLGIDRLSLLSLAGARRLAFVAGAAVLLALLAGAALAAIPRVSISPADGQSGILPNSLIRIEAPSFSSISKVSVTVNGEEKWLEYNIADSVYAPPVHPASGSTVTVDVKTTSAIGLVREFSTTYTTIDPLSVTAVQAEGRQISPASVVSPQAPMSFSFDKPVEAAWVSIDGAASLPMTIGPDGLSGDLQPSYVLKQGTQHKLVVTAAGRDGSGTADSENKTFQVVQPLTLAAGGNTLSPAGTSEILLQPSVPFSDVELVKRSIQVSDPERCAISVEPSGIRLTVSNLGDGDLIVSVASAFGADGSYLELPAEFRFKSTGEVSENTTAAGTVISSATAGTSGGGSSGRPGALVTGSDSDVPPPPPGWPPCCPWPPR